MLLQETERSQKDAYDGLLSPESGLSKQENKIRYVKLSYQASIIIFIFNLSDIQWYTGILSKYVTGSFINLYKAIKTTFFLYGRTVYHLHVLLKESVKNMVSR